jgi:hypothetical protein
VNLPGSLRIASSRQTGMRLVSLLGFLCLGHLAALTGSQHNPDPHRGVGLDQRVEVRDRDAGLSFPTKSRCATRKLLHQKPPAFWGWLHPTHVKPKSDRG